MFSRLFARLTNRPRREQALFNASVAEARKTHWYLKGQVPDTREGRFAVLSSVIALITVRLEKAGPQGDAASAGLAERLIEALDAEIRQMGAGDPALGRQVRTLVAATAARVGRWRQTVGPGEGWRETARWSLYGDAAVQQDALSHCEEALRQLWGRLERTGDDELITEGRLG